MHKFTIAIPGNKEEATDKANALATIGNLDVKTLQALAYVIKKEPAKVKLAKQFLGIS